MSFIDKLTHRPSDADILAQMKKDGIDIDGLMNLPSGVLDLTIGEITESRPLSVEQYNAIENEHFRRNFKKD